MALDFSLLTYAIGLAAAFGGNGVEPGRFVVGRHVAGSGSSLRCRRLWKKLPPGKKEGVTIRCCGKEGF